MMKSKVQKVRFGEYYLGRTFFLEKVNSLDHNVPTSCKHKTLRQENMQLQLPFRFEKTDFKVVYETNILNLN